MTKRLTCLLTLCFCTVLISSGGFFSHAQDDSQLHIVTGDEFLRAISDLLDTLPEDADHQTLVDTLTVEWQLRGLEVETVTPEEAHDVYYDLLLSTFLWFGRDVFIQPMLQALINDEQIQLDPVEVTTTQFHDFEIEAQPRDFNADGQPEWILHVSEPDFTQGTFVVENDAGTYRFVDAPLPWFGCCFSYWSVYSGFMEEQRFEDLTGDGIPEWVLAVGGIGGNNMTHGWLIVLQWRDGELVDIAPQFTPTDFDREMTYASGAGDGYSLFPYGVEVTYGDVDANGTTEIIITQDFTDNWGCQPTETRIFTWQDELFQLDEHTWDYPDSAGCALRSAQEAMWADDYASAIPLFERSIILFDELPADEVNTDTLMLRTYAGVRLALAYSFMDRIDEAIALLSELEMPEDAFAPPDLIPIAQQSLDRNAMDLCLSLYVTFYDYFTSGTQVNRYLGVTYNVPVPVHAFGAPDNHPENAGCDAPALIDTLLNQQPFTTSDSPIEQLLNRGISPTQIISADFNEDAQDDWVVWLHPRMSPIFFASQGDEFVWSRLRLANIADDYTTFSTIELPDDAGLALVAVRYREDEPLPDGAGRVYVTCETRDGDEFDTLTFSAYVSLWRYEDMELTYSQSLPLCERLTAMDIFSENTLTAWRTIAEHGEEYDDRRLIPATYVWNSGQMLYILPEELDESSAQNPAQQEIFLRVNSLLSYDLADSLERVNTAIDNYNENYNVADYQLYYMRGVVNELLGNSEAALADYRYVYGNAPDEAWRMLAALHIA